jgi:hypothetical protein
MSFSTDENNFGLTVQGDYLLNSSFPMTISQDGNGTPNGITVDDIDPYAYLLNRGNLGFGLDLGAIYHYTEKITLSASLLDLGFVSWKTDVNNVRGEGSFVYDGGEVTTDSELVSQEHFIELGDSIMEAFNATASTDPFTHFFPTQLYLGASYQWKENVAFGLVNRNLIYSSKLHSSLTVSARANLLDRILTTVSWSYLNHSFKNVGIGLAYHGKGFQLHAVTDNLIGFFYPFDTRSLNLRLGMNLMLGCPRKGRQKTPESNWGRPGIRGECPWVESQNKIRKKRMKSARRWNR